MNSTKRFLSLVLTLAVLVGTLVLTTNASDSIKSAIGIVDASGLRLREGPGTDTEILTTAYRDDYVVILEAEGEAQAILAVQKANADAIRLLNEAMPSDKVLAIRSLEALAKVANGKATKIIIPSELQNLGGVVPSIKELMTDPKDAE